MIFFIVGSRSVQTKNTDKGRPFRLAKDVIEDESYQPSLLGAVDSEIQQGAVKHRPIFCLMPMAHTNKSSSPLSFALYIVPKDGLPFKSSVV